VAERRKDPRTPYISRAEVSWNNGNEEVRISGMIEDKSVSGLGIQVGKPIPVGTSITVRFGDRMAAGVVRRCVKLGVGVLIGMSFEADQRQGELKGVL
jgi:hypothetical protein